VDKKEEKAKKPSLEEQIAQIESEMKQLEAEYWKRVGQLEVLKGQSEEK
tara:strand:+ start:209 stop:355 length:147 start_codon:yes stop_codon:yes gene_type:complete